MFIHDIIKIKFVEYGYLPDIPYHLISDSEMCDAFMDTSGCQFVRDANNKIVPNTIQWVGTARKTDRMFDDYYPLNSNSQELRTIYQSLIISICYFILQLKQNYIQELPNWIYSYMLRSTISPTSEYIDIEDLCKLANVKVSDTFTDELYNKCYRASKNQLQRIGEAIVRHPTVFGEPHVIKELRTHGGIY